jgi:7-cyano-7-deazaguanine synthase
MIFPEDHSPIGVLLSGGLDSSILLGSLLNQGFEVQPFYVRSGLAWEPEELQAVRSYLIAVGSTRLRELVVLDLPLDDLYESHWSRTGRNVPGATSSDDAVYLPGRNALLIIKTALWCQLHGIRHLALGVLGTSPFADAKPEFFTALETALNCNQDGPIRLLRPFAGMGKHEVMKLGDNLPLEHTFSCISPQEGLHCGQCNKCVERQSAFSQMRVADPTQYAVGPIP